MDIFWGHDKIGLYLGVISMHFRVFPECQCTELGYFLGCYNFKYFLGCLKFLIFLGANGRCWARTYVCRKNESTPLGGASTMYKRNSFSSTQILTRDTVTNKQVFVNPF